MNKKIYVFIVLLFALTLAVLWSLQLPSRVSSSKRSNAAATHTISRYTLSLKDQPITIIKATKSTDNIVIFLHGYGGNDQSFVTRRLMNELGNPAYATTSYIFPSSSKQSFWHNRTTGPDAGNWADYVMQTVIPDAIIRTGSKQPRIIIAGVSMGGFGALHIAQKNPRQFCAVAGHSAAIWPTSDKTAKGSFDSVDDFNRTDVIKNVATLGTLPVWLDNGNKDWFLEGADAFESAAKSQNISLQKHVWPGNHDGIYWDAHWGDYLAFYNNAFSMCKQ